MRLFAGFVVQPFSAAVLGFIAFPLVDLTRRALEGGGTTDNAMRAAAGERWRWADNIEHAYQSW